MAHLLNCFKLGKSIFSTVLVIGLATTLLSAEQIPQFVTQNVPLLQGKYTKIGFIQLDSSLYTQLSSIQTEVKSNYSLAGIRVMAGIAGTDDVVLAENLSPSPKETLVISKSLPTSIDQVWIEIMPQKEHDLLDKIQVKIPVIYLGKQKVNIDQALNTTSFRTALELRNY